MIQTDGEIYHDSWIRRININKITVLPNTVYRFSASSIRLPMAFFFHRIRTKIVQFVWKHKRPQIAKAILKKKNGAGGIGLLAFRLDYKATVIQTVWYCHKNKYRSMEQDKSPEIITLTYGHIMYAKIFKNTHWRKDSLFNKWCWAN